MLTANLMLAVLIWVNDCAMCGGGGGVYQVLLFLTPVMFGNNILTTVQAAVSLQHTVGKSLGCSATSDICTASVLHSHCSRNVEA